MQPAFFLVILIAVHVSVPVDCRPRLQDSEQLAQHQQGRLNMGTHVDTSTGTGRFYSVLNGSMTQSIYRGFLAILPVRTATSNFVSIFDLRRKQFLCMDLKGELYISRQKDREDCLFQRIWLNLVNHNVFYSITGRRLLNLEGGHLRVAHSKPPEPSSALLERFLSPVVKRQRRSEEVNPSDPLRTEANPSHSGKVLRNADLVQPEQDQTGAVSKETITSCDDPLSVLRANAPGSPVKTNIADRADQD